MRFKRLKRRTQIHKGQLDIAPLIDIVFQLLIFFMLTSNFVLQTGIKVNLPRAITSEVINSQNIVVTITGQDLLFLDEKPISIKELEGILKEAALSNKNVLLKADGGSSIGRVVEIWDMCRDLGISQINIATNNKKTV